MRTIGITSNAMKETKTRFGQEIRNYRLRRGLTQKEFAEMWGIHGTQVSIYEQTNRLPTLHLVKALCEVTGLDAMSWLDETHKQARPTLSILDDVMTMRINEAQRQVNKRFFARLNSASNVWLPVGYTTISKQSINHSK